MSPGPARLLCAGKDLDLLRTRCAVLSQSGYDAESATVPDAEHLLRTEEFDLVIVSAFLDEWEKGSVLSAAGKSPTLVLRGLILAPDLLVEVERRLAETV
jgi:DNA-binding response OmpR family regulator